MNVGTEPEQVVGDLNRLKEYPGAYGDISFTPERHDGYPDEEVIVVEANSLKNGAFKLTPGYGAWSYRVITGLSPRPEELA